MPLFDARRFQQSFLRLLSLTLLVTVAIALLAFVSSLQAQSKPLITAHVDEAQLVSLKGSRPAQLKNATDLGNADESQPSGRLMLVLKRSDAQESEVQSYLQSAHQTSSPNFHKWLAPGEFGKRFGAADSDVQQVTAWMQAHGLTVEKVAAGKSAIEFNGTIGQVNQAFHASIHKYSVNGEMHYANAADPQVPAAFGALVAGVTRLDDFKAKPQLKLAGQAVYNPKTHQGIPQWTFSNGAAVPPIYYLTPEDFSTQYDVKPLYAANINGAGQTIGIINDSNIDLSLVNAYRTLFGLPANPPQVVIDGNDPGVNADAGEAYLDVENAGAIAPAATVKLYIAGTFGLLGDGGIYYSAARAIDDDAASVLSLSFSTCEQDGTANNQIINAMWEQAAAQGQTVLVSTGDNGSQTCSGVGLSVNAFASTPWDVAVGGTDAYFGDYASGGASIASFWSNTNDANLGSLQKPMSEQPWNGSNYGLNSTTYDPVVDQPGIAEGGGGGASNCAVTGPGAPDLFGIPTCVSGYPKPSWQVGPGVPNDTVRDLPDVSLFASNGFNGVLWPICEEVGDCTVSDPALGGTLITGVGGTSASAPAMAGILALINQKYGPQGQVNYTLYPMAVQFPTAFNDVTVGSNNMPCTGDLGDVAFGLYTGCSADTNGDGFDSFQHYSATSGYDQASGLGTLDVNQLYNNWGKLTYATSATTLALTPTTITHGQSVLASVTVTGNKIPSGPVALVTSTPLPDNKGLGTLVLGSNGSVQQQITTLPGGTYTVIAEFSGDGLNGPSKSQPVSVTVAAEASVLTFSPVYLSYNGALASINSNHSGAAVPIKAGNSVPYGSDILLDVSIAGSSGNPGNPPTGTVTFSDGSTAIGTALVSAAGTAEFNGSMLSVGSHTITASYSGDPSYKASTIAPFQFSVARVTSAILVFPDAALQLPAMGVPFPSGLTYPYTVGQIPDIEAIVEGNTALAGVLPTGTMTFQLGSNAPVSVPLITDDNTNSFLPTGGATQVYPHLAEGTYPLVISYSGDANYSPATVTNTLSVTSPAAGALLPTTTTLTTSPSDLSNISSSTLVTLTATITGSGTVAPTGAITLAFADIDGLGGSPLVPGTGNTSTATITAVAGRLASGNNVLNAFYRGDSVYAGSASAPVTVYDDPTDFSFQTLTPNVAIKSGSTGTATLSLGSVNGFNGTVALTCAAPSSLICTFANASVSLNGTTTANVTLNTVTTPAPATTSTAAANHPAGPMAPVAGSVLTCMLLIVLPRRRRFGRMIVSVFAIAMLLTTVGCNSFKALQTIPHQTPTPPAAVDATPGSYNVVVTGTSANGILHNTTITVIVQ